jgi:hypothetical protein
MCAANLLVFFASGLFILALSSDHWSDFDNLILANVFIIGSPVVILIGVIIGILRSKSKKKGSMWSLGKPGPLLAGTVLLILLGFLFQHISKKHHAESRVKPKTQQELRRALSGADIGKRIDAAYELMGRGQPVPAENLRPLIQTTDPFHRMHAVQLLGQLRDKASVEPMIRCLEDDALGVRLAAARSLGLIGDPHAVKSLAIFLEDPETAGVAAEALGMIGSPEAIDPLIDALQHAARQPSRGNASRIAGALKTLTGRDFGHDAEKWRTWKKSIQ